MQDPPHRARAPLQVRTTFEPTRLAIEQLVVAYDQVVPTRSRPVGPQPGPQHSRLALSRLHE